MPNPQNFVNFANLPQKNELLEKFELPDKSGFELLEKRRAKSFLPAGQPPFINWE